MSKYDELYGVAYIYAIVELDEGIRMPANILNCSPEDLRINFPLILATIPKGDKILPAFQPLSLKLGGNMPHNYLSNQIPVIKPDDSSNRPPRCSGI